MLLTVSLFQFSLYSALICILYRSSPKFYSSVAQGQPIIFLIPFIYSQALAMQ
jgi:hypothetical protein